MDKDRRQGTKRRRDSEAQAIAAVERDTGLSKDTLRVWERRYGFPQAMRNEQGERVYAPRMVARLRVLKRLVDAGYRPGRIIGLPDAELDRLLAAPTAGIAGEPAPEAAAGPLEECLRAIELHDVGRLQRQLRDALARQGVAAFVHALAVPLLRNVGEGWMRGRLQVYQEHMASEQVRSVLQQALQALPDTAPDARPRLLFGTFPGEPHGLTLVMAQLLCSAEGAACIALGTQTPLPDLRAAADAYRANVLVLAFSGCGNPQRMLGGLAELRAQLPTAVELWAGGGLPGLHRRTPADVQALPTLESLVPQLQRWRERHAGT